MFVQGLIFARLLILMLQLFVQVISLGKQRTSVLPNDGNYVLTHSYFKFMFNTSHFKFMFAFGSILDLF